MELSEQLSLKNVTFVDLLLLRVFVVVLFVSSIYFHITTTVVLLLCDPDQTP